MNRVLTSIFLFIFSTTLFGQCVDGDCFSGQGEYKFKNGTYTGTFNNGNIDGQGLFVTRKGYSYDGDWQLGVKSGNGTEMIRKTINYSGNFENNLRNGNGEASFPDTKYMKNRMYVGQWSNGAMCGKGEYRYDTEVKYGRAKVLENNKLDGDFVNGVYQGRMTSSYSDELIWKSFDLKTSDFQNYKKLSEKERKKLKNPATIEGDIIVSCECMGDIMVFETFAILRKELSWWSTQDIPPKTKEIILNTRQKEFDIIQWYALDLELQLNKQKLSCSLESWGTVFQIKNLVQRECIQTRKAYNIETAWNPKKGGIKNKKTQNKWNKKIDQKLESLEKKNKKYLSKIKKKEQGDALCDSLPINPSYTPPFIEEESIVSGANRNSIETSEEQRIFKEEEEAELARIEEEEASKKRKDQIKKDKKAARKKKWKSKSFKPQFPRSDQLE